MFIKRAFKVLLIVIVAFVFASVGNALAATNVVPASSAGDGSGAISGYTISLTHYVLNATNPGNIDSVTFTLSAAPVAGGSIKISLDGTNWYSCTNVTTAVTCVTTAPQATVLLATNLRVVVAQ
jgi:hypothetical protein